MRALFWQVWSLSCGRPKNAQVDFRCPLAPSVFIDAFSVSCVDLVQPLAAVGQFCGFRLRRSSASLSAVVPAFSPDSPCPGLFLGRRNDPFQPTLPQAMHVSQSPQKPRRSGAFSNRQHSPLESSIAFASIPPDEPVGSETNCGNDRKPRASDRTRRAMNTAILPIARRSLINPVVR
jgi:hypothetical protein